MKYVPPYGISDEDAPYINGDPSIARAGSIPPAAAFEHPMREIVGVIEKSEFVPDETDLLQLTKSVRSQFINFADDTGTVNTLSVAFDPPIESYTLGLPIRVRVNRDCSGASTIDAGAGRVNIRRPNGSATVSGDLTAGGLVDLVYDGTAFQMINFLGTGGVGSVSNYLVNIPYCVDTSTTANIVTAPFSPALTTLAAGQPILVKIAKSNTGPTTINVNALSPKTLKASAGGDLLPDDIIAGAVMLMVFDGTNFIIDPNTTIVSNVTINVPTTQFNTPDEVFEKLNRKLIGPSAIVTVQLAAGVYAPVKIYHPCMERIYLKGTMIGAAPTLGNFSMTGAGAAARASDAALNIAMLRSRYGTEIRIPTGAPGIGVHIQTGTVPHIFDLLIACGDTTNSTNGIYNQSVICTNVVVWGCRTGFTADSVGFIGATNCFADNCFYGFAAVHGGNMGLGNCSAIGCVEAGFYAGASGYILLAVGSSRCNGHYGMVAGQHSHIEFNGGDSITNGWNDIYSANLSLTTIQSSTATNLSPVANTFGNNQAINIVY